MEKIKIPKYRIIHEETAEAFEKKLNDAVEELAEFEPAVEFNHRQGFCAYLIYQPKEKIIIETVADEFHLEGISFHCRNCPHLDAPQDRRVKWCKCKYSSTGRTHKDKEACELFYKQLKQNAIEVIEDTDLVLW